jgi:hypothetical protein
MDRPAGAPLPQVNYCGAVSVGTLAGKALQAQGHGAVVALSSPAERPGSGPPCGS